MKVYQTYIIHKDPPSSLELLVQLLSVCNHKVLNPEVPIIFVTDRKSFDFFENLGFLYLYDEVILHLFDDYPSEKIHNKFWASPKVWLMSKIQTPFIMIDTDLILNKPLYDFPVSDLVYLHRELQSGYLRPYEVSTPIGYKWDGMEMYFRQSIPINVSTICFRDEDFKNYYVDQYFKFVFNNPADVKFENLDYVDESALQTFAEQYLLAAHLLRYTIEVNPQFVSTSLSNSVHGFGGFYSNGNFDQFSHDALNDYVYHLWGGKKYVDEPSNPFYINAYHDVTVNGENYLKKLGYWDEVKDIFLKLKSQLPVPIVQ